MRNRMPIHRALPLEDRRAAETPDALDWRDHMQFKRSKLAKLKRRAKARIQAMRSLKGLGASAG